MYIKLKNMAKNVASTLMSGVIAGELSLLGALAARHLVHAYQQLGRG
jgi:hydroxymethylglutaryl-CoA reductase (NADPH)